MEKGATAAVFGLGTIGLACVDALATVGASRIIGVDTDPGKHARAKEWGATDVINPKDYDKPIQVQNDPHLQDVCCCIHVIHMCWADLNKSWLDEQSAQLYRQKHGMPRMLDQTLRRCGVLEVANDRL